MHPLRTHLRDTGQTLEAFAAKVGSSAPSLSRIINGKQSPSLSLVGRILAAAGGKLSANDFLPPAPPPRARARTREQGRAA